MYNQMGYGTKDTMYIKKSNILSCVSYISYNNITDDWRTRYLQPNITNLTKDLQKKYTIMDFLKNALFICGMDVCKVL